MNSSFVEIKVLMKEKGCRRVTLWPSGLLVNKLLIADKIVGTMAMTKMVGMQRTVCV